MDLDLAQLRALRAAVDEGTFEAAARVLHVTPSAVSQRIKALEAAVGRVLLARSTPVRPSPSGQVLLRLARQVDLLAVGAAGELGGGDHPVTVVLAVNADSLATWVLPALAALAPGVCFDVRRDDEEHTAELLREGSVMAAVTAVASPVPGCTTTRLGAMRYRPMASPAFAAAWLPSGATAEALAVAPVVVFDRKDALQDRYLRERTGARLHPPRHHVPATAEFAEAIRLGLGWGMVPDLQSGPDEAAGRLVDLDPGGATDVALHWQQWKLPSSALERTAAAVRSAAAAALR